MSELLQSSSTRDESADWMLALVHGRESALRQIIDRWQAPLLHFVFRYVQNEADARDIVQETFVRVYQNRSKYRDGNSFSTWLFTIAVNLCRNRRRWERRHPTSSVHEQVQGEDGVESWVCPRPAPDRVAMATERVRVIREAIAELPHDQRTILLLYEYENLSYREIGEIVGCSERAVEARLARARAKLRDRLTRALRTEEPLVGAVARTA